MPTSWAEPGFVAAARIARPSHDRVSTSHSRTSTRTAIRPPYTWAFGRNSPPKVNDSSAYDGRIAVELLPQISPIAPSSTSARPKVNRTVDAIGAVRIGETDDLVGDPAHREHDRCRDHDGDQRVDADGVPEPVGDEGSEHHEGAVGDVDHPHDTEDQGQPTRRQGVHATQQQAEDEGLEQFGHQLAPPGFQPSMSSSLVAKLLGQHELHRVTLPLPDQEVAVRRAVVVPLEVTEDGRDRVLAQPVGHRLLVVDAADGLGGGLEHLAGGVRVGGVLRRLGAVVHLLVLGDELGVARGVRRRARG